MSQQDLYTNKYLVAFNRNYPRWRNTIKGGLLTPGTAAVLLLELCRLLASLASSLNHKVARIHLPSQDRSRGNYCRSSFKSVHSTAIPVLEFYSMKEETALHQSRRTVKSLEIAVTSGKHSILTCLYCSLHV